MARYMRVAGTTTHRRPGRERGRGMRFDGQVVVVTGGGGSGLGTALAHRFSTEGAAVVVADADEGAAARVAAAVQARGGRAIAVRTDVRREQDARELAAAATSEF